jgi:predicted site-specific integrase-resolvase
MAKKTSKKNVAGVLGSRSDWVTQKEAADARGVSLKVVNNWVGRGRLTKTKEAFGKVLVSLSEVLGYEQSKGGRTPQK